MVEENRDVERDDLKMFGFWIWMGKKIKDIIIRAKEAGAFSVIIRFSVTVFVIPFLLARFVHPAFVFLFLVSYILNLIYQVYYLKEKKGE